MPMSGISTRSMHLKNGGSTSLRNSSLLKPSSPEETYDVISVGFGPAALAVAVALHDALEAGRLESDPKICFLERQPQFAWHAGMQIPGATMQISWIKDLATIRNPRSHFTFLNYLHNQNRLLKFSNLGTFLPLRREYEDYMRWCADGFDDMVEYQQEAIDVIPEYSQSRSSQVDTFLVKTKNLCTGEVEARRARHVIIAGGGKPRIPKNLPQHHPRVIHSANYMQRIENILSNKYQRYRIAVIGAGQSAGETFNDLQSRYPNCETRLIIRDAALKPSDDSPFVNEIFDPERTDGIYNATDDVRSADIDSAKATNYSVVRLELLEHLYANLYEQHLDFENEHDFPHQILNHREVLHIDTDGSNKNSLSLRMRNNNPIHNGSGEAEIENEVFDVVIVATGYERSLHEQLLANADSLKIRENGTLEPKWIVSRDYRVQFRNEIVSQNAGVWLQGCCENTHGLSDTLLSVLAARAGELVRSIFEPGVKTNGVHTNGYHECNGVAHKGHHNQ